MARNRMIKPGFWDDEKLATNCSRNARLLFIGLWNYSDDYGVVKGHPLWLKNQIFSYDNITIAKFEEWLGELSKLKRIIPFTVNNEQYFYITHFLDHQVINNPSKRVNPVPPKDILKDYGSTKVGLPFEGEGKGKGKGKEKKKRTFLSDSIEVRLAEFFVGLLDVREYPWSKKGKPNLQNWAIELDKIIRLDGREPEKIKELLEWVQQDEFWQNNVLSPRKLRKQWGQLEMKMRQDKTKRAKAKPEYPKIVKCNFCEKNFELRYSDGGCDHCNELFYGYRTSDNTWRERYPGSDDEEIKALTDKVADSMGKKANR